MPKEPKLHFVFLLKFNKSDLADIAKKLQADQDHWAGSSCTFTPVAGEYDMIALAEDGTEADALNYAVYLTKTGRYRTTTLTAFSLDEFVAAVNPKEDDPKRR
jgi:uncharacterized protein with GYD domain